MRFGAAGSANEYYVAAGNNLVTGGDKGFLIYNSTANQPQLFIEQATRNVKVFAGFEAAGALAIGNTVAAAVAIASTHKVTIVIGGVTYYLLATNVA
jgi:UDP-N-acetylmuramyl pentapeptide phosphotransferase/UDP-N-acetylglucosamine-1-phosphate transferase